jgi:hypothetical protein
MLFDVITLLKVARAQMGKFEKTVVLQYDEIKVHSVEEYDVVADEVVAPHNQMQVVMARGLFSNWKQPIYIAFDQKMTKEILLNIVTELSKISYRVIQIFF